MNNLKKPSVRTLLTIGLFALGMFLLFKGSMNRNDTSTIAGYAVLGGAALVNVVLRDSEGNKNRSDKYPPFEDPYGQSTFPHEQPFDPNAPRPMTKEEVERLENSRDPKRKPLYIILMVVGIACFMSPFILSRMLSSGVGAVKLLTGNYLPIVGIALIMTANIIGNFNFRR